MNSTFTTLKEFTTAIQAVAAEAGVSSSVVCLMSNQDELFDDESHWQVRFNQDGPVVNIIEHDDPHADDDEDRSYRTAALLECDKADAAYSFSRSWPRNLLFDLREKLIPGYINAVVETPEGFAWRVMLNGEVRNLPVKVFAPENNPSGAGDYEFDLDTDEANAFFNVPPCVFANGEYIDYEKAVDKSAERLAIRSFWWTGDGDSFGPLVRCVKFTLANGVVLHASYG